MISRKPGASGRQGSYCASWASCCGYPVYPVLNGQGVVFMVAVNLLILAQTAEHSVLEYGLFRLLFVGLVQY